MKFLLNLTNSKWPLRKIQMAIILWVSPIYILHCFGLLISAFAVGGLLGSLVAERVEQRLGRARVILITIAASLLVFAIPLLTSQPVPIAFALALSGVVVMWWNVVSVSLRQRITPDHLLGRLNAAYRFFGWGAGPLGALVGGLIAQVFGLRSVFVLALGITVALLWLRRSLTDEAMDAAVAAADSVAERQHEAAP